MSWLDDASANRIVQSYINNFMDVSGNFKVRPAVTTITGGVGSSSSSSGGGSSSSSVDTTGASWTQLGSDVDGLAANAYYGYAADLNSDGTIFASGGYNYSSSRGYVTVYEYSGGSWSQLGNRLDGEASGDVFGISVALSDDGTILAVGAQNNDGNGSNSGHARVYQYNGSSWGQLGSDIDGEAGSDRAGVDVALSGDGTILAVGAWGNDGGGTDSGHVRVYQYSGGSWTQLGGDIDGSVGGGHFGWRVALSNDGTIVAGSGRYAGGTGHTRIFEYSGGSWSQMGSTIAGDGSSAMSGWAIDLSKDGSSIVIGSYNNSTGPAGSGAGEAQIFKWDGSSWNQVGSDLHGDGAGDYFGIGVAMNDDGTIVGVGGRFYDSSNGNNSGHARIYHWDETSWNLIGSEILGEAAEDQGGNSLALSDDGTIFLWNAYFNDGAGSNAGHVRVYDGGFTGTSSSSSSGGGSSSTAVTANWTQLGSDIDGEATGDEFGYTVSLSNDGTIMAVGAIRNDATGDMAGHVRAYQYSNSTWTQLGSDIDGEAAGDWAGRVSLSGDGTTMAIGAIFNDGATGSDSGHVRVYKYSGGSWSQLGSDIDGEAAGDRSGVWVSLSDDGTIVAIGAYTNDGNGTESGQVRVYQYANSSWTQLGSDIDGEAAGDRLGYSVALSSDGTILAAGAYKNDGNGTESGHVRVYEYSGSSWSQLGSDIDGEAAGDQAGNAVSLSSDGTIVAVGAWSNNGNGTDSGHTRVYQYANSTWTQLGSDIDGEAAGDHSGSCLSLSSDGTILAIGAYDNDGNGSNSGHVRVYQYVNSTWTQIGSDIDGEAANDRSGFFSVSISSDGNIVAIGAYLNDGVNGTDSGHVRVYDGGFGTSESTSYALEVSEGTVSLIYNTLDVSSSVVDISGTVWLNEGKSGSTIDSAYQCGLVIESSSTSASDAVLHIETAGQTQAFSVRANGDIYADNALSHSSDDRRKINEQHITNAMETLNKLSPQIYIKLNAFLENGGIYSKLESGLIAQEIYYNAPELRHLVTIKDENGNDLTPQEYDLSGNDIQNDPDYTALGWGPKSAYVNYIGLIPYLIKANQEKQAILDAQEATITQQTSQVEDLKTRLSSLEAK